MEHNHDIDYAKVNNTNSRELLIDNLLHVVSHPLTRKMSFNLLFLTGLLSAVTLDRIRGKSIFVNN